jgi:hypothetical protein
VAQPPAGERLHDTAGISAQLVLRHDVDRRAEARRKLYGITPLDPQMVGTNGQTFIDPGLFDRSDVTHERTGIHGLAISARRDRLLRPRSCLAASRMTCASLDELDEDTIRVA